MIVNSETITAKALPSDDEKIAMVLNCFDLVCFPNIAGSERAGVEFRHDGRRHFNPEEPLEDIGYVRADPSGSAPDAQSSH